MDSSCVFCVCVLHSPCDTDNNFFTTLTPQRECVYVVLCISKHLIIQISPTIPYVCQHPQILTLTLLMGIFTVLTLQYHLSPHQHHLEVENKSHNFRTCTQTAFKRNLISHLVPECAENRVNVESFLMQKVNSIQKALCPSYVLMIFWSSTEDYLKNLKCTAQFYVRTDKLKSETEFTIGLNITLKRF